MFSIDLFFSFYPWVDMYKRRAIAFELDRRVLDAESFAEERLEIFQDMLAIREILHQNMCAHRLLPRGQCPDMEIVDIADTMGRTHGCLDLSDVQMRWNALH